MCPPLQESGSFISAASPVEEDLRLLLRYVLLGLAPQAILILLLLLCFFIILRAGTVVAGAVGSSHSPGEERNPMRHATRPSRPCCPQYLWLLPPLGKAASAAARWGSWLSAALGWPGGFSHAGLLGWKSRDPADQHMP